ncbi:transmembrane protein 183 isoform X1 [Drosophila guanche]|uniref:Blast:Transmembrane protein 183 n=1 Tax=Drosophila guanche TaxID=7266 RepID=A0A3B0JKX9_DROGU|nr:transmembrane protein 183 isoform X1 [Drosophila guanche]SPP73896.1 blast:Transmembrane protein 183 [Drosophila guanche]
MNLSHEPSDCNEFIKSKLYRTSGKCAIYARQAELYVQVKPTPTVRVHAPASSMAESNNNITHIRHDIWFHIAMHIDPEDVQTFALICKQTAILVSSRAFWRNLYKRYCVGETLGWNLVLPAHLQMEQICSCDTKSLRSLVVKALFYCHRPLKVRLEQSYNLDWLLHRTFVTCWQKQYQCLWVICYKFWNKQPGVNVEEAEAPAGQVVNDWESLADEDEGQLTPDTGNPNEGVVLLVVVCRQFVPTPTLLAYSQQQARYRLRATRELLCTDMRAKNLELDFAEDTSSNATVTVKYPRIAKYKVLPWWHPDFQRFVK